MASEQLASALDLINKKIAGAYETIRNLKNAANALAASEGNPAVYQDIVEEGTQSTASRGIRPDQFTALPSPSTAARAYLEIRGKDVGAATLDDIFDSLKKGGYAFDGNDSEAKKGLSIALGKDGQVKRLSNGYYGLMSWYGERFSRKDKGIVIETVGASPNGKKTTQDDSAEKASGDDEVPF